MSNSNQTNEKKISMKESLSTPKNDPKRIALEDKF